MGSLCGGFEHRNLRPSLTGAWKPDIKLMWTVKTNLFNETISPAHRPVHWSSIPGGLPGVPQGQWHRRPGSPQGDGLPGCAQPAGDIRRGAQPLRQQGLSQRGDCAQEQERTVGRGDSGVRLGLHGAHCGTGQHAAHWSSRQVWSTEYW
ncbi:hypothetical protein PoB_001000800 [Plakobranchus ocellatus]|uniref:Uncharacterized protein n=1 Tax=Plakobranchus ocellatus TaxID=259542 RepID=A0AAV3YMC7_9GAST|nr:hypothetical protein PoB_001000800 [Plakobranchus ocellatus]